MELLDRYLHALKTYLPKAQQRDIVAELSDNILSDVEEQEALLGRTLNRAEEVAVLRKYGHPLLAAGRYLPQQYLIGPGLYAYYWFALKVADGDSGAGKRRGRNRFRLHVHESGGDRRQAD